MNSDDLDYFCEKEIYRQEEIISAIDCVHEESALAGILILTDCRLAFVRKAVRGFEVLNIESSLILDVDQRIDRGLDFILRVVREEFVHEFELRGIDMASKQAFVDLIKEQVKLFGVTPGSQSQSSPLH